MGPPLLTRPCFLTELRRNLTPLTKHLFNHPSNVHTHTSLPLWAGMMVIPMPNVYFSGIGSGDDVKAVQAASVKVLEKVMEEASWELSSPIPLKLHFGEKGNVTYLGADNLDGIIDLLEGKGVESFFTDTNVLYRGERMTSEKHIQLAKDHGFTRLPVRIADGEFGNEFTDVEVDGKHFSSCKIGSLIAKAQQLLVISHFKGHMMAGYGGAIKQLAMGCAARGGKLAIHLKAKPTVTARKCNACGLCAKNCPVNAIQLGPKAKIDKDICIGCVACMAVCPSAAIGINWLKASIAKTFKEKVAEYALAAQLEKQNIYINFAVNLTKNCDCYGKPMKPKYADLGVLASLDPVAIDKASLDLLDKREGKKTYGGRYILEYGEAIGLGSTKYELVEV